MYAAVGSLIQLYSLEFGRTMAQWENIKGFATPFARGSSGTCGLSLYIQAAPKTPRGQSTGRVRMRNPWPAA